MFMRLHRLLAQQGPSRQYSSALYSPNPASKKILEVSPIHPIACGECKMRRPPLLSPPTAVSCGRLPISWRSAGAQRAQSAQSAEYAVDIDPGASLAEADEIDARAKVRRHATVVQDVDQIAEPLHRLGIGVMQFRYAAMVRPSVSAR